MCLPNPKSPCLNSAGSDVLHCFVTRLQIPSIPCSATVPYIRRSTASRLSVMLKEILHHFIPLYRAHITVSALSRSHHYLTLILMEIICLKDLICECELNFSAAFAVQHLQIVMTFDLASLVRILTTLSSKSCEC